MPNNVNFIIKTTNKEAILSLFGDNEYISYENIVPVSHLEEDFISNINKCDNLVKSLIGTSDEINFSNSSSREIFVFLSKDEQMNEVSRIVKHLFIDNEEDVALDNLEKLSKVINSYLKHGVFTFSEYKKQAWSTYYDCSYSNIKDIKEKNNLFSIEAEGFTCAPYEVMRALSKKYPNDEFILIDDNEGDDTIDETHFKNGKDILSKVIDCFQ